jgi:long-chain fatty acid transport protein
MVAARRAAISGAVPEYIRRVSPGDLEQFEMILIDSMDSRNLAARYDDGPRSRGLTRRILVLLVISPLLMASTLFGSAQAGGLYVNEFSTASQGNAGAGRGAWAPDASATLHNPASMTKHDDHAFATGFSLFAGDIHFDSSTGANGGNQAGLAPIASFSYVHKVSDRVRFGLSFFSISGSVLDPSNDWAGRFQVTDLSLLTISITPTVAVRITDWLSIGGGPVVTYGVLDWKLKVAFPAGSENGVRLDKLDDWKATGRVGLLLHPREDFSLSVYYNGKTDFSLRGSFNGPAGLDPDLNLDLPLVQFVQVSTYWQLNDRIALLGTFGWEDWSDADKLKVTLGGATTDATIGFNDTYKIGVGANYRFNDEWLLQTGIMYDSSALKNKDRTAALPIDEQIRFAIGAQYSLSESLNLGLSLVYVNLGDAEIRTASLRGDYKRNHGFVFGMTLAFKELPWSGKATFGGAGS